MNKWLLEEIWATRPEPITRHKHVLEGKGSPPPPPDYAGAAQAQGAANVEAAKQTGIMSNPNVYTPLGNQIVTFDPTTNQPTVRQELTPIGQQQFDLQQGINTRLGGLAQTGLGYVENTLSQPFDHSQLPEAPIGAGQTAQDAILARLEPTLQRQREQENTQLYNRGITAESSPEAYQNAMRDRAQRENDLLIQAGLQGINTGQQARQQAIQEQSFFRNEPLNILNAVRSASPVAMPQFQGFQGSNVQAAPIFAAAQAQDQANLGRYSANQAAKGQFTQGLFNLGSAYMMGGF